MFTELPVEEIVAMFTASESLLSIWKHLQAYVPDQISANVVAALSQFP